jgi:hypothetical protein
MVIVIGCSGLPIEDIPVCSCSLLLLGKEAQRQSLPWCSPRALQLPSTTVRHSIVYIDVDVATCKGSVRSAPSSIHIHIHIAIHTTCASFNSIPIQFTRSFELRCPPLHTLLTFLPRLRSPQGISPTPEVERLPGCLQGSSY